MKNAFLILEATPNDDVDKLRELFEEKQLFLDDDTEINYAYNELINLKKRIKHEIRYFSMEIFEKFNNIFINSVEDEEELVIDEMCFAIIQVGKWFDLSVDDLFNKINESRKTAKFSPIGNSELVQDAINELKTECIMAIKKSFDYLKEKDIILLYNTLVKKEDYICFFIDDLLSIYEDMLRETIVKKEQICTKKFDLIEKEASKFIDNDELSMELSTMVTEFKKVLNSWDKIVQPLQVNFANRGAQHELSVNFAATIRNKVIDMCNKAQERLTKLITFGLYYNSAKQKFVEKLVFSKDFVDILIKILDVLMGVFAEIEVFAERLKKDKSDFNKLKEDLSKMINQIDPYGSYRSKSERKLEKQKSQVYSYDQSNNEYERYTYSKNKTTSSSSENEETWKTAIRWIVGIVILVSGIGAIVNFSSGTPAVGVFLMIICITTIICAYQWGQLNIKFDTMKTLSVVMAVITALFCIISAAVNSEDDNGYSNSDGVYLTTYNFDTYFYLSSDCEVTSGTYRKAEYSYSIYPKSSFDYSDSDNPYSITVTIGLDITSTSTATGNPDEYKIYVTLYKSDGYRASGTRTYNIGTYEKYWDDGIYSVSGTIYP